MPWPVHPVGFFGSGDQDTYKVERSLRFNSADSAYLNRTPTFAGNRKTWTWSGWVKRSESAASADRILFSASTGSAVALLLFDGSTDKLRYVEFNGTSRIGDLSSTSVYRDYSSWYHIVLSVDTTQATASNRARLYVNGIQLTQFETATYVSQNTDSYINGAFLHTIGKDARSAVSVYFGGYLTEINFIDGQALTPSSFGETDAITGRWKAKAYSGTYGTNGFYLKFADNSGTTATTLGKDSSGNGNNWTPNNFSVTAGAGDDSLIDSPTDNGTSGNYCVINPINQRSGSNAATLTNGNLNIVYGTSGSVGAVLGNIVIPSGKWYAEASYTGGTMANAYIGVNRQDYNYGTLSNTGQVMYIGNGNKRINGVDTSYGASFAVNDIIGMALDTDNGTIEFFKNNVSQGVITNTTYIKPNLICFADLQGVSTDSLPHWWNFGQRSFAYTAPTGFKALCTTNLPTSTIKKPGRYMDVKIYTGTGASNSITGLDFSPDLVWIKNRGTTTNHAVYDTTRGGQFQISTNSTAAEVTSSSGLTAFGSNGFTIGTSSLVNTSGTQYVAWAWDKAPIAGMDIVSYVGNGANRTIAHSLGIAPSMMIFKVRDSADGWGVYHESLGNTQALTLETTGAVAASSTYWNNTSPTSSLFSIGTWSRVNNNSSNYIAYLFAEIKGFSKFGLYGGNGSSDGPYVWCGFRPRWIMIKRSDSVASWQIYDTERSSYNVSTITLAANQSDPESSFTSGYDIDILSNGFKLRAGPSVATNTSGGTYIFAAFAESQFKYARAR